MIIDSRDYEITAVKNELNINDVILVVGRKLYDIVLLLLDT